MFKRTLILALLLGPVFAADANAQRWDAPLFFSPKPMDDIGLYYFRTDAGSFGDIDGLKAIWRQSGNINLGVQVGLGDIGGLGSDDNRDAAFLVGAEFYNPIGGLSSNSGLVAQWAIGAGAVIGGDYVDLSIPVGVSVGLNLGSGGNVTVLPYVHPRVSFDYIAFDDAAGNEHTDHDFGFAADLGADLNLGQRFILRFAYNIASENDVRAKGNVFGVGAALRIPRKLVVR